MPPRKPNDLALRPDFVFDIETIPDTNLCRQVYGTSGMSDEEAIACTLAALRREPDSILPEAFQKPVAIVACTLDYARNIVRPHIWIEGTDKTPDEASLLAAFWQAIEPDPESNSLRRIVSFNGKNFDMRVIEVRSLQYENLSAPVYFKPGEKYDLYRHKYNEEEHLDLLDYIPNYGSKAGFNLRTIASLVGLPGKDQLDGSMVYPTYLKGGIMEIAAYCLEDVIQTALIKMRLDRLRGILDIDELHRRIAWFLDAMEQFTRTRLAPKAPAFEHTADEIRDRYRPALLTFNSEGAMHD